MRKLEVFGLTGDGTHLLLADPDNSAEQFVIPCDDKLRAAARRDLSRFGQLELEMSADMRPREIQSRIRAGASVEQVAATAGTTVDRIEPYAHPILLERASFATKAQSVHPLFAGVVLDQFLADTVASTLTSRGHGSTATWDAYKGEDGWVLVAIWKAGRSELRATFDYRVQAGNPVAIPRDQSAVELLDCGPRTLRAVTPAGGPSPRRQIVIDDPTMELPKLTDDILFGPTGLGVRAPKPAPVSPAATEPAPKPVAELTADDVHDAERPDPATETVCDERAGAAGPNRPQAAAQTGTDGGAARPKRHSKPVMPSWEDILLGKR